MRAANATLTAFLQVAPEADRGPRYRSPLFLVHSEQLGALALRHAIPAIALYHPFAAAGGLVSYGANQMEPYRLVGISAGKILHGEKPADLPDQQATQVELIINLGTAKAFGLTVPLSVLGRAR